MSFLRDLITGRIGLERQINRERRKFYEGGQRTRYRQSATRGFTTPEDTRETAERLNMICEARYLADNFPLAEAVLDLYEMYVLGNFRYQPMTGDAELNAAVSAFLEDWFDDCDISGRFDFRTAMRLVLRGKKRDGEAGIVHVWDDNDYRIQIIDGDRIGDPMAWKMATPTDMNGILLDEYGRVISYEIYSKAPNAYAYTHEASVEAEHFSHFYDPKSASQYHGVTAFKTAITRLRDIKEVQDFSRYNIKYRATQLPVVRTQTGDAFDDEHTSPFAAAVQSIDKAVKLEHVEGAEQMFLRIGEDVIDFPHDFPNGTFLPFVETVIREILIGLGLTYEFAWNPEKLTGTIGRLDVSRVDRRIEDERGSMQRQGMRLIVNRAIYSGMLKGVIPMRKEAFKGTFYYGPKVSADHGRDVNADVSKLKMGMSTETEYFHMHGKDPEAERELRKAEALERLKDADSLRKHFPELSLENAVNQISQRYQSPPQTQSVSTSETIVTEEPNQQQ